MARPVEKLQRAVFSRPAPAADVAAGEVGDCRAVMLAHGVDYRACQRLDALGVAGRFVAELGAALAIGQARVSVGRRFWEPVGPDARLLLACFDGGVMVDVAAVSTAHPDQVHLRTGLGWCLGRAAYDFAFSRAMAERHVRLRLFADPLEWLRGSGEGICVLDWAAAVPHLRALGERVTIEAADAAAAAGLRAKLERGGLPLVSGPMGEGAALSLAERLGREAA